MLLTACSDFFDPSTDDEFNGEDGFTSNTEMYTGFLGIMTKLQAVGDKEILLTEPRGELIEPSNESTTELIALCTTTTRTCRTMPMPTLMATMRSSSPATTT